MIPLVRSRWFEGAGGVYVVSYRALFGYREFRYLYGAQTLSYFGDQLGAIAIAVLVFDRTGSGLLTAVAYAAAWLPGVFGGPVLAAYADRLPRRTVMITCDLVRAALVAVLVVPGMPVWGAIIVLYVAHLCSPPFFAARSALMPDVLPGDLYVLGNGLGNVTFQVCQLAGFAAGGLIVALIGPTPALMANAVTFAISAVLVARIRRRAALPRTVATGIWRDTRDGFRYVFTEPWLRGCLLLVWVASAFCYAPEGIAYPYAVALGGGPTQAGMILAAPCVGFAAGALVLTRALRPELRDRFLAPGAVLSTVALIPAFSGPPLPVLLALLVLAGAGASFAVPLNAAFVRRVARELRGRAMGVAMSGLLAAQGVAFLAAGAAVQAGLAPSTVVGASGLLGAVATGFAGISWRRAQRAPAERDAPLVVGAEAGATARSTDRR